MQGVFIQANEAEANRIFAFRRGEDGMLGEPEIVATEGRGDGMVHLTSQGSVVVTSDDGRLLVTNAGSDDVTVLTVTDELTAIAVTPSGGTAPKSVTEHDGLVYVLNTGDRSLVGFRLADEGLVELAGSRRELGGESDPAQVGFAPSGAALVVTDRGANAILVFPVAADGSLREPRSTALTARAPEYPERIIDLEHRAARA